MASLNHPQKLCEQMVLLAELLRFKDFPPRCQLKMLNRVKRASPYGRRFEFLNREKLN
jgi:hypothetical protein